MLILLQRKVIEAEIDRLIDLLDAMDGDPDLEPETVEPSEEHTGGEDEYQDMEPSVADIGDAPQNGSS